MWAPARPLAGAISVCRALPAALLPSTAPGARGHSRGTAGRAATQGSTVLLPCAWSTPKRGQGRDEGQRQNSSSARAPRTFTAAHGEAKLSPSAIPGIRGFRQVGPCRTRRALPCANTASGQPAGWVGARLSLLLQPQGKASLCGNNSGASDRITQESQRGKAHPEMLQLEPLLKVNSNLNHTLFPVFWKILKVIGPHHLQQEKAQY